MMNLMGSFGMEELKKEMRVVYPANFLPVILDGVLIGYVDPEKAESFVE